MAYQAWYRGQTLEQVTADIDTKVRAFLDDVISRLPALPPIPVIQFPPFPFFGQQPSQYGTAPPQQQQPSPQYGTAPQQQPPLGSGGDSSIIGIAGDWQASGATKQVMAAMEQNNVQFILTAGDYNSGNIGSVLSPKYKDSGRIRGAKGNHDGGSDYSIFGQSGWNTATKINSAVGAVTMDNNGITESELDQLTSQLKSAGCKIIIYVMHMPCVTASGDHHSSSENKNCSFIEKVAQKYGVQLLVNGHNHYYGRFNKNGRTYITVGTAGGGWRGGDGGGGAVKVVKEKHGFLKCVTNGNSLNCSFIDASNNAVLDTFTISAGSSSIPVTVAYRRFNRPQSNLYSMWAR